MSAAAPTRSASILKSGRSSTNCSIGAGGPDSGSATAWSGLHGFSLLLLFVLIAFFDWCSGARAERLPTVVLFVIRIAVFICRSLYAHTRADCESTPPSLSLPLSLRHEISVLVVLIVARNSPHRGAIAWWTRDLKPARFYSRFCALCSSEHFFKTTIRRVFLCMYEWRERLHLL